MMFHKDLTPEKWFSLSLFQQLANVGSDVIRAIQWKNRNRHEDSTCAIYRALELLDLTIADPKHHKQPRLKELLRTRELLVDHFCCDNEYSSTNKSWENYFMAFTYAAALERGR